VAIVGDIVHSRVARSGALAFATLGADVTLVAPPTLLPSTLAGWPVTVSHSLGGTRRKRQGEVLFPSLREYTARYGLTVERAARLRKDALVMHPGPMNRGGEIAAEVAEGPAAVVTERGATGVAVRMAVLYSLLGSGAPVV